MSATITPIVGNPRVLYAAGDAFTSGQDATYAQYPKDTVLDFKHGYWGQIRAIYARVAASQTIVAGSLVTTDSSGDWIVVPNTANTGKQCAVALAAVTTTSTQRAYIWVARVGNLPTKTGASVAAGTGVGVGGAGVVGAISNGKQVLGAVSSAASTATVVKTARLISGSTQIYVPGGYDGWWPGMPLTGTGVGSSAVITALSPDGRTVTVDVASSASGDVSVTCTYTGWIKMDFDNPFVQGQTS